jgi:alpha-glucuronidase
MQYRYHRGVSEVEEFCQVWKTVRNDIDEQRWQEVEERMQHQLENAREWCDTCLQYFGKFANSTEKE